MEPTTFKEVNQVFAKNQKDYNPLPAYKNQSDKGEVVACWRMSLRERLRILITGRIWISLLSFNRPLTPHFITSKKSDVLITKKTKP